MADSIYKLIVCENLISLGSLEVISSGDFVEVQNTLLQMVNEHDTNITEGSVSPKPLVCISFFTADKSTTFRYVLWINFVYINLIFPSLLSVSYLALSIRIQGRLLKLLMLPKSSIEKASVLRTIVGLSFSLILRLVRNRVLHILDNYSIFVTFISVLPYSK